MTIDAAIIPFKEHFSALNDPCAQHSIEHLLLDIVLVIICAVICDADTWVEIENYGIARNLLGVAPGFQADQSRATQTKLKRPQ